MIVRKKKGHYEIEMFHVVQVSLDKPEPDFNQYLLDLANEFVAEINAHRFSMATLSEYKPVTRSHEVVQDTYPEVKPNRVYNKVSD